MNLRVFRISCDASSIDGHVEIEDKVYYNNADLETLNDSFKVLNQRSSL